MSEIDTDVNTKNIYMVWLIFCLHADIHMPLITLQLFEFRGFFYHCVLFTHSQKIYTEYIKKLNYIFTCYDKTLKFQDDKKSGKIIICDITHNIL